MQQRAGGTQADEMTRERIYMDYNATAPLLPEAREAMIAAMEATGNASSVHAEGRAARGRIEDARLQVAALVGARAQEVVFTGTGSEANTMALTPHVRVAGACGIGGAPGETRGVTRLLVGAAEHPSVLAGGRFDADAVERIPVDGGSTGLRSALPGSPARNWAAACW